MTPSKAKDSDSSDSNKNKNKQKKPPKHLLFSCFDLFYRFFWIFFFVVFPLFSPSVVVVDFIGTVKSN